MYGFSLETHELIWMKKFDGESITALDATYNIENDPFLAIGTEYGVIYV